MLYHKECIQYYWAHCEQEEDMSYDLLSEHGGKPSSQRAFMLYAYSACVLARVTLPVSMLNGIVWLVKAFSIEHVYYSLLPRFIHLSRSTWTGPTTTSTRQGTPMSSWIWRTSLMGTSFQKWSSLLVSWYQLPGVWDCRPNAHTLEFPFPHSHFPQTPAHSPTHTWHTLYTSPTIRQQCPWSASSINEGEDLTELCQRNIYIGSMHRPRKPRQEAGHVEYYKDKYRTFSSEHWWRNLHYPMDETKYCNNH